MIPGRAVAPVRVVSHSAEETFALGRHAGQIVRGGDVLALCGPLGAGKTQFVKGLAAGLGVPPDEPVVSPTFVLVREYAGRLRLLHLDAYRLVGSDELLALGFDEMLASGAVIAVEWGDRVESAMPPQAVYVELSYGDDAEARVVEIRAPQTDGRSWVDA